MDESDVKLSREEWLAIRNEAALTIDPETARVTWRYGEIVDPYAVHPVSEAENSCIGRLHFACAPESDIWVSFDDLPDAVREALWQRRSEAAVDWWFLD